jgi:hypothetical protein
VTVTAASFHSTDTVPSRATQGAAFGATSVRLGRLSSSQRREVVNAMRHLNEMPPFARDREINTGRYSHFSSDERELLRHLN